MAESPVIEGQVLAGKYRVERVLGSGGMVVVVAAWHLELEQRVAVKFLHPLALERADTAERFRREARSAAKIRSEHVARVIDVGIMEGGVPYMVMEYLEGHDLSVEMTRVGMLPIADAIDFVLQAVEALAEAHMAGIVHRDLKPANLFIATRADGSRIVKVLDFGISKSLLGGSVAELSLTRTSVLIGSPLYMSPEQMRSGRDVDMRTDIWSLGVILYEMITSTPPYTGDSIPALCAALLSDVPVSMQVLRADVPIELENVIMRCLAKDRQERFGTVSELARALAPFASASSQLHVDRASRLMGGPQLSDSRPNAEVRGTDPAVRTRVSGPERVTPARGTVDSWGRTDALRDAGSASKSKRRLVVGAALSVLALVAVGLFVGLRQAHRAPAASASIAAAAPALPTAPVPSGAEPMPASQAPRPAPEGLLSAALPTPSASSASPSGPDAASAPLVIPGAPITKPKLVPVASPVAAPAAVNPKPAPLVTAKPAGNDLSEFGGRR